MNQENTLILAKAAYEDNNFDSAYSYFQNILEENPSNGEAWINKGLSAGWLSEIGKSKLEELISSIRRGYQMDGTKPKDFVANQIQKICSSYFEKISIFYKDKANEFEKIPMAKEGSVLLHGTLRILKRAEAAKQVANERLSIIDALVFACELNPTADNLKYAIAEIDKFKLHSDDEVGYLKPKAPAENKLSILLKKRDDVINLGKSIPNFIPSKIQEKKEGCFIATAVYGDYDSPVVVELRQFRDVYLLPNKCGQIFIKYYYKISPFLAKIIRNNLIIRFICLYIFIIPCLLISRLFSKK